MFTDPKENLNNFGLEPKMTVADLGCGTGAYSLAVAQMVGPEGRVLAVDVQKDLLTRVKNDADKAGLSNVEILWGDIEELNGTGIRDHACDAVIVSNILFQTEDKNTFLKEAHRILKPHGKLLLIEWLDSFGGMGPMASAVINPEKAKELLSSNGFTFEKQFDAGSHHYGIVAKAS